LAKKNDISSGITIVGGRPMQRAVPAESLPQGVEQVLTIAALDPAFRARVAADPVAAAAAKGIEIDSVEAALLRSIAPAQLAAMAERLVIPPETGRREFVKVVSASIVALVTGKAMLLCSGCTGAEASWRPDSDGEAEQKWMNLAGHTCYVYVPAEVAAAGASAPVVVALHGEGETCLSSVQRWHAAADANGFNLLAINWTEEAATPETWDALVADLPAVVSAFAGYYQVASGARYLTSRGASTALAWRAAYLDSAAATHSIFAATVLLGGVPPGDWPNDSAALVAPMVGTSALYYVIGTTDTEYAAGTAFYDAVVGTGVLGQKREVTGSTDSAVLDFTQIWQWVSQYTV